jgi:hypothetical protein
MSEKRGAKAYKKHVESGLGICIQDLDVYVGSKVTGPETARMSRMQDEETFSSSQLR